MVINTSLSPHPKKNSCVDDASVYFGATFSHQEILVPELQRNPVKCCFKISSVQIHTNSMKEHKHATLTNQMFHFCFGAIKKKYGSSFFNGFLRICSSQHSFVSLSEKQLPGESSLLIILKLHWRKIFDFSLSFSSIAHAHL